MVPPVRRLRVHGREAAADEHGTSPGRGSARARLRLGCDPAVVAEARQAVQQFAPSVPEGVIESARLLVSELVTNSIVHGIRGGGGWIDVLIEYRPGCLRIEVLDPASAGARPVLRRVDPESTSGWGLHLVDRLATEWGVETGPGTRVWCEIATR
jgi:anti-sigma regulatory factor (Ser/Thr protein kinase)